MDQHHHIQHPGAGGAAIAGGGVIFLAEEFTAGVLCEMLQPTKAERNQLKPVETAAVPCDVGW